MREETLALVDLDRLGRGDGELDLATFLAEIDFEDPAEVAVDEIERSLIAGYARAGGRFDPDRLAWYRAHKRFSKAHKAIRTGRPGAAARARRCLARAAASIGGVS